MGGLLVREPVQGVYPEGEAGEHINKIVTLGPPHQGISFQFIKNWLLIDAEKEVEHFNPELQDEKKNKAVFTLFGKYFPLERRLTVVGTTAARTMLVLPHERTDCLQFQASLAPTTTEATDWSNRRSRKSPERRVRSYTSVTEGLTLS
jgi:hypothetical protein